MDGLGVLFGLLVVRFVLPVGLLLFVGESVRNRERSLLVRR